MNAHITAPVIGDTAQIVAALDAVLTGDEGPFRRIAGEYVVRYTYVLPQGIRGEYRDVVVKVDDNTVTVDVNGSAVCWTNPTVGMLNMLVDYVRQIVAEGGVR
jgi:hypothetical protein